MAEELFGWQILRQLFIDNGLSELADSIVEIAQEAGADAGSATITEALRKTDVYKTRFKANFDRLAAGKTVLSEGEYLYQERLYTETMKSYQAGGLATRENFASLIANDVSVTEVSERFSGAYNRVTKAVNSGDKALVDELRKLYPGITDNEIANSLLLGNEGAKYLTNKLDIADIKAAETEAGVKSSLGAERLAAEGINRGQARIGLNKVAEQKAGYEQASRMFGETSTQDLQKELEQENLLGQTSKRTKRLASQSRAQFSGQSGIASGSLGRKKQI
jgi:hypothetical protein